MRCLVKHLGQQDYPVTWQNMKTFTDTRDKNTLDEFWVVEHPPVFTLGQAGKMEHLLKKTDIPVLHVDRGGQITYHGPGQVVIYVLIDIKRKKLGVRELVTQLEKSVIDILANFKIIAHARKDAPGVYIDDAKICSIGLKIRRGCSFHGLAFNVNTDLTPFKLINPCGYPGLKLVNLSDLQPNVSFDDAANALIKHLLKNLGYTANHS